MLSENRYKKFTASNNVDAEKLLAMVLDEMCQALAGSEISVYLGGSYGRGEGGVRSDSANGLLYNDLDFFVFARQKSDKYNKLLQEISEKYEHLLKVDIDFSRVITVKEIKQNSKRLMMQELKRGHVLVYGEDLLAEFLPELSAEKLPFSEAARLLLNRGIGLLWANEKISCEIEQVDFILRNINKAILGAGDALLISKGDYRWHIQERCEAIMTSDLADEWKELYRRACEFKSSPSREIAGDITQLWQSAKKFYLEMFLKVVDSANGDDLAKKIYKKCKKSGELSLLNYIKYVVKSFSIPIEIGFFSMPHAAVLIPQVFAELANGEGRLDLEGDLYKKWLKFN
jgi:hypothetical protein